MNHGERRTAGELAAHAIRLIVPPDRLRLTRLQIAWPQLAGERLSRVAWPGYLRGTALTVWVRDTQWQHELVYMHPELLKRLAEVVPDVPVESMRFRVGDIPELLPEPPPPPPVVLNDLPDEPATATVDALHGVEDEGLRKAMATARLALSGKLRK